MKGSSSGTNFPEGLGFLNSVGLSISVRVVERLLQLACFVFVVSSSIEEAVGGREGVEKGMELIVFLGGDCF